MPETVATCKMCGEPMPEGETMFKYHGYSGPCPKPPLAKAAPAQGFERHLSDDLLLDNFHWSKTSDKEYDLFRAELVRRLSWTLLRGSGI